MLRIDYEHEGKVYGFDLPTDVSEITFSAFVDFQAAYRKYAEHGTKHLLGAVSLLVKGPLQILPVALETDSAEMIQTGRALKIGEDLSLFRLFAYLVHLADSYKGEALNEVEYKGDRYYLPHDRAARFLSRKALTAGEVLEVEETRSVFEKQIKEGDPEGVFAFSMDLHTLAILLRPKGHQLPHNPAELDAYIDHMSKHFKDIDLKTVLDVRFFLIGMLRRLSEVAVSQWFSTESPTSAPSSIQKKETGRIKELKTDKKRRAPKYAT